MKSLAVVLLSLLFILPCVAKNKPTPLSADSVINLSIKAYGHLKTYSDSGKLIQTFLTANPHKTAIVFKTAYVNTGDINFEYYVSGNSSSLYTINRTNNAVKTWWGILNRTEAPANMQRALGAALGVSGGTSMIVPGLLLTADFKNSNLYSNISKRAVAAIEQVNGKDCYKITGTNMRGPITVWIGKKDFLIRKIEEEHVIDPAKTEAMTRKIDASMKDKGGAFAKEHETAMKNLAMIHRMDSLRGKPAQGTFTVKNTFSFFPIMDRKIDPELLKFRPNREVVI
jgi:hypothetical protein